MAISTWNAAPDMTNGNTFWKALHPISAALATFGWIQTADTGQMVWPVSIISITNAVAAAGTVTFTYTLLQGAALRAGSSIQVRNCTTAGLNATYTILTLPLSTTFTAATGTTVTEAETALGSVDVFVTLSACTGTGGINTYNYVNTDGVLINGQSVVVTGFATSGFNGTFTVASINTGAGTWTATTGITHVIESVAAQGIVTCFPAAIGTRTATTIPPSANVRVYEVWCMNDGANQTAMPCFIKISIGDNNNSGIEFDITVGSSTNGSGTITGGTTGLLGILANGATLNNVTLLNQYMSGNTNRLNGVFFPGTTGSSGGLFSIERSHDSTGADTSSYVTVWSDSGANTIGSSVIRQISFNTTTNTVAETKFCVLPVVGTGTGSFGNSTLISPCFPLVGAIGNPSVGVLVGKNVDWTDQTQFSMTLYNTARNYIITSSSLTSWAGYVYSATATCCVALRYD